MEGELPPTILGLPDDFDVTEELARDLQIDSFLEGVSLQLGLFGTAQRLMERRDEMAKAGNILATNALQLLLVVSSLGLSDIPRSPFDHAASGTFEGGRPWHTPLPEHLTESHVRALSVMLETISTPVLRARIADVLWYRLTPRNPQHARAAIESYLNVAADTFDPDHWTTSERHFSRAFSIAVLLGSESPEFRAVIASAWDFLGRLQGADNLYYTERLVSQIIETLTPNQIANLSQRIREIIDHALRAYDFNRARTYFGIAIALASRASRIHDACDLRLERAETYVLQADASATESQRSILLRQARTELLNSGALRERVAEVSSMLDVSQALAVHEMASVTTPLNVGVTADHVRDSLRGMEPIEGLWRLAALPILITRPNARRNAEESASQYVFAFGFGHRPVARDGRQEGYIPGSIGSRDEDRERVLTSLMRKHAMYGRMQAVLDAIEPGRRQLLLNHEYPLREIAGMISQRPLIPSGHSLLWAKAIHAGLVGEYDIAVHILAPQLENALRTLLRGAGEIVYVTRNDVQSLIPLEAILDHPRLAQIIDDDHIFALDCVLAERLGANVRNHVAHGMLTDAASNSVDSAFVWWLALRMLGFYGPNPL
jgi:Domain of unknown function (DUF4209)